MTDLTGRSALAIVTNYGVEQDELTEPLEHLREAGATVTVAATEASAVETLVGDKDPGRVVTADITIADVDASTFDLLLIPGGTINADQLRLQDDAISIVREFASSGRPIAAICHGPWALATADVLAGKQLTSYASIATDLRNAGAQQWVDEPVVTDDSGGWTLITSRTPDDLDDFLREIDATLAA